MKKNSEKQRPYLSIVAASRNDDHGGNLIGRMELFIQSLSHQCRKYYLEAELIIVEWNPPPERKRLAEVVQWPDLSGPLTIRIIEVPAAIHNRVENAWQFPMFQMVAKNVGIRRARGEFVLATNIDILFSDELIWALSRRRLQQDCHYRVTRHDVDSKDICVQMSFDAQAECCRSHVVRTHSLKGSHEPTSYKSSNGAGRHEFFSLTLPQIDALFEASANQTPFTNACGDFTLMSRQKWHDLRGYPELHDWGLYVDGLVLYMAHAVGLRQIVLADPMRIYHLEHQQGWQSHAQRSADLPSLNYEKQYRPWCEKMERERRILTPNGESWGYVQVEFMHYDIDSCREEEKERAESTAPFQEWIDAISRAQKRIYYRDQTSSSLSELDNLVRSHRPDRIIEIGTLSGLSLRTWLATGIDVPVTAIDLSFEALRQSRVHLPVDLSRVQLVEQDVLEVDFGGLWHADERVLLFIDAHDEPGVPIMAHLLGKVIPRLPRGSRVVVDDMWYSSEPLDNGSAPTFFRDTVLSAIDPLQTFEGWFAPYWKGGSFFGFREVAPLMQWVNSHRIELEFRPDGKEISFVTDGAVMQPGDVVEQQLDTAVGRLRHDPLAALFAVEGLGDNNGNVKIFEAGTAHFAKGNLGYALRCFDKALEEHPAWDAAVYARALVLARQGRVASALKVLEDHQFVSPIDAKARQLGADIKTWQDRHEIRIPRNNVQAFKPVVTLFCMPKAFEGHIGLIQRNAICSWTRLRPKPEIILMGDEPGIAEIAAELGLVHIVQVQRNEFGTPLLNSIMALARQHATNDIVTYINADIILMNDFNTALSKLMAQKIDPFLMVGRRWDLELTFAIDFNDAQWAEKFGRFVRQNGKLHADTGVDYFVYPKQMLVEIPPFALGRTAWDMWLVWRALHLGIAVVDATAIIHAVHQNHDYSHLKGGKQEAWEGVEANRNLALSNGYTHLRRISDATYILTPDGLERKSGQFMRSAMDGERYDTEHIRPQPCNPHPQGLATWASVCTQPVVRFYAGDLPNKPQYDGWVGLSLVRHDTRHIRHNITIPFPIGNNTVDHFQAEDVFEHVAYNQLPAVMEEIHRILKPGGLLRISVPDYRSDVLYKRSQKDTNGNILFDPFGGGTPERPGHLWFPRYESVKKLVEVSSFSQGCVKFLHYYDESGTPVTRKIDYSLGFIQRTPDCDARVQNPYRPLSIVVDLFKVSQKVQSDQSKVAQNRPGIRVANYKNSKHCLKARQTPVALIAYNRPAHTQKVLESLRRHECQNLYVFMDGPKSNNEVEKVAATRQLIQKIDWTTPHIVERSENIGLARSIVSSVNAVLEHHDRLIVLEDDCVPQEHFFDFMNRCLDKYSNHEKIFGVCGHTVYVPESIKSDYPYDVYFSPRIGSWGWGTWKRAWNHLEYDFKRALQKALKDKIDLNQGGSDIPSMILSMLKGDLIDVWTLNWILTVYLQGGYYIYPTESHIKNVGMDGSGIHCGKSRKFDSPIADTPTIRLPDDFVINTEMMTNFCQYYNLPNYHSSSLSNAF